MKGGIAAILAFMLGSLLGWFMGLHDCEHAKARGSGLPRSGYYITLHH